MIKFQKNKILKDYDGVGEQLRQIREEKEISLKKVSKRIKITPFYLNAIEKGNSYDLPQGIYRNQIIKKYSEFLGVNFKQLKEAYLIHKNEDEGGVKKNPFSTKKIKKINFFIIPKIVRNIIVAFLLVICFSYLGFYLNQVFSSPKLTIINPAQESITTQERQILIKGITKAEAEVNINQKQLLTDENGTFSQVVNLKQGINTIEITAKKKYGRENVVKRQILVQPN